MSPSYWGMGLMQEALLKMIRVGFDVMKLDYIEATTEIENIRSQNLLKKIGFNKESDMKDGLIYFKMRDN